jgi:hypothetical protein
MMYHFNGGHAEKMVTFLTVLEASKGRGGAKSRRNTLISGKRFKKILSSKRDKSVNIASRVMNLVT